MPGQLCGEWAYDKACPIALICCVRVYLHVSLPMVSSPSRMLLVSCLCSKSAVGDAECPRHEVIHYSYRDTCHHSRVLRGWLMMPCMAPPLSYKARHSLCIVICFGCERLANAPQPSPYEVSWTAVSAPTAPCGVASSIPEGARRPSGWPARP